MLGTFWVLIEWGDNSSPIRYPNPLPFPLKSQAVLQLCKEDGRLLGSSVVKNPPAKQDMWVPSRVGEIPWRREWLPTPVILPGESRGQKGLEGYSPWGHKRVVLNSATKQQQTAKKDGKLWMSFKQEKKEHKSKSHILILRQVTGRMLITKKKIIINSRNKTEPHQSVASINWWDLKEMPV